MPKLTNKYNLPSPFPEIIEAGGHAPREGRYSVTDLLGPPLIRTLKLTHYEELCSDVSDYLWMLMGTAVDEMLSKWMGENAQVKMEHDYFPGITVVGVADVLKPPVIEDWKVTSVYTLDNNERLQEYANQLNMYVELWDKTNMKVDSRLYCATPIQEIYNNLYLRDWIPSKAKFDPSYPKIQFKRINQTPSLLPAVQRENLLLSRLVDHMENPDRECTPEEKWQSETTYAVKKKNRKTALRVLPTDDDAIRWMANKDESGLYIEERPGKCARCLSYCPVSNVCPFFNKENK